MSRPERPDSDDSPPTGLDWRGWVAVAWVVSWGAAYALMAIQARGPLFVQWIEHFGRSS